MAPDSRAPHPTMQRPSLRRRTSCQRGSPGPVTAPQTALQRLRLRRHTCNVQHLALGRCTVCVPLGLAPPSLPSHPHPTHPHPTQTLRLAALLSSPLPPLKSFSNLANPEYLTVDFEANPSLKVISSDPLVFIHRNCHICSNLATLGKP